jgi:hypothetical protein
MIRYESDRTQADAAPVKSTNACPEGAGGPCITEPPDQIKKEEPKAGTYGLEERQSSALRQSNIWEKPRVGNKDSELAIPTGSALIDELGNGLNTTRLRDDALGIRPGETLSGTLYGRNSGTHWRFLDEDSNFIEPGSSYHGEFIARVGFIWAIKADLALIAWRPVFGSRREYVRFARFNRRPFEPIQLFYPNESKLGLKMGNLVEFVAKVTVYIDSVDFQIPTTRLKLVQPKGSEEVQSHAS